MELHPDCPLHSRLIAYSCFLSDLTRFTQRDLQGIQASSSQVANDTLLMAPYGSHYPR